jgi:hypothetical protein
LFFSTALTHVPTQWQETLPDFFAIGGAVRGMGDG